MRVEGLGFSLGGSTVNSRKLEHGLRTIRAGIPSACLLNFGVWDKDVPTFWNLLQGFRV